MAISIDKVYQRVLALANKEQRGYITPQEFNLLAGKAQSDIFESYFHDKKAAIRIPGNQSAIADDAQMLREKINVHRVFGKDMIQGYSTPRLPSDLHWLESVYSRAKDNRKVVSINFNTSTLNETTLISFLLQTPVGVGSPSVYQGMLQSVSHISLAAYGPKTSGAYSQPVVDGEFYFNIILLDDSALSDSQKITIEYLKEGGYPVINLKQTDTDQQTAVRFAEQLNEKSKFHKAIVDEFDLTKVHIEYLQHRIWTLDPYNIALYEGITMTGDNYYKGGNSENKVYEQVDRQDWNYILGNKKLHPTSRGRGIFTLGVDGLNAQSDGGSLISALPVLSRGDDLLCDYIKKPADPNWGYVVVNNKALYNNVTTTDSLLHESEEGTLTNKILELAGILINKPGLSEVVLRNEQLKEAIENK